MTRFSILFIIFTLVGFSLMACSDKGSSSANTDSSLDNHTPTRSGSNNLVFAIASPTADKGSISMSVELLYAKKESTVKVKHYTDKIKYGLMLSLRQYTASTLSTMDKKNLTELL